MIHFLTQSRSHEFPPYHPQPDLCIYFVYLTFADIYLQCSNDFTPVNYYCKKNTPWLLLLLLSWLGLFCFITSRISPRFAWYKANSQSVTFQHHVWFEIFFISVLQTLGSHRRYAFLFLIDHYYKKLGLNKRVQLPPSPMASVLISYAFVMIMTISFHIYWFTEFTRHHSPKLLRNFKQKAI